MKADLQADRVAPYQVWTGVVSVLLVMTFHTFPRGVALSTLTAAPWMILLVGGLTLLLFWPVAAALARRPGHGLIDLALEAGGRPLAIAVAVLLCAFVIGASGMSVRQVSEMAITATYPHTPQTWIMSSLVLAGALGAHLRVPALLWIGMSYFWPSLIAILIVVVGNVAWGQFANITPIAGPGLLPLAGQALPLTSYFGELVYLTVIAPYLGNVRRLVSVSAGVVGVTALVWGLVLLVYLMVFPLPSGLAVPFPVFEMTRLVQGGRFLERADAIWLVLWTFGSAGRLAGGLLFGSLLFRDAFRLPDHRQAVLPLAMAVMALRLYPSNQSGAIALDTFLIRRWGFLATFLVPAVVALLALRKRGGQGA
ncbi:MAG: GerAB/ArcD/ProY family transporter [Bacillota bacterium]